MKMFSFLKNGFFVSVVISVISLLALVVWRLKPGIDFTGGSLLRIEFLEGRLSNNAIKEVLNDKEKYGQVVIQPVEEKEVIIKLKSLDEATHQEVLKKIQEKSSIREVKFDSIGSVIGQELKRKSALSVVLVVGVIILFIAWSFKGVSNELSRFESFRYGVAAVVALSHDILVVLGVFAFLGQYRGVEVDTFFIAALLTILGYSVNDTIIVFDRIRENVLKRGAGNFRFLVMKSIKETLRRSLMTSFSTLLILFCILLFGGQTTFYFVLALIIGIASGTYSSIFIASPILVWWREKGRGLS